MKEKARLRRLTVVSNVLGVIIGLVIAIGAIYFISGHDFEDLKNLWEENPVQSVTTITPPITTTTPITLGWSGEWSSRLPGNGFVFHQVTWGTLYYDVNLSLVQKGNTVTGSLQMTLRDVVGVLSEDWYKTLRSNIGKPTTQAASWAVSPGNTVSWRTTLYDYNGKPYPGDMYTLTLTAADRLYGTVTWNDALDGSKRTSTFDLKRNLGQLLAGTQNRLGMGRSKAAT